MNKLTAAGWPRPIVSGMPIPWVSPSDDLATMNSARSNACASGAICQVCGLGYQEGEEAYVLVKAAKPPRSMRRTRVLAMDNGILHLNCLKLSLGRCPRLRQLREDGMLQIARTKAHNAVLARRNGQYKATFDGTLCRSVKIEEILA